MPQKNGFEHTNALINETSPYLLQHAHNPVNWNPWNEEVIDRAKKENKLLIISIGYSACHWCHVMEHESFEDSLVAEIMNDYFIPIKVDREERPDIDDIYMTACQIVSQGGCGWPLNAFALPDGRPIWAGTYFPKDQWINILNQFKDLKANDPDKLQNSADRITEGILSFDNTNLIDVEDKEFSREVLDSIVDKFLFNIDFVKGGRQGAPKFPMPSNYEFLLKYYKASGNESALQAVITTLDKMAYGGIYDQIGGGFARYSVDADWLVPHFEKMLYDNGQLVSLYSNAYKLLKTPKYKDIVAQTIAFVERELLDDSGGFYSSLDADSEGEEGKFYVWDNSEFNELFSNETERDHIKKFFGVTEKGNWEHTNILYVSDPDYATNNDIPLDDFKQLIENAKDTLFQDRTKRERPGTDDKILTSWNALMLKGLIDAYTAFGNEYYLTMAKRNAQFIIDNQLNEEGRLNRNYKEGRSTINGFLDDYATTVDAFLRLYEVTFDEQWLTYSKEMMSHAIAHFEDSEGFFYYTSDLDPPLVARKKEMNDNVISSSNSIMARNLQKLGQLTYNVEYLQKSEQMMLTMESQISETNQPNFYANWCQLYTDFTVSPFEIAILGEDAVSLSLELQAGFNPDAIFLGGTNEGSLELLKDKLREEKTLIYVCKNRVCKFPVEKVEEAEKLME